MISKRIWEIPVVAGRQGGLFTIAQARAEGWSPVAVRREIAVGHWVRVVGHAFARGPQQAPWGAVDLGVAAHLSLPRGVVSHTAAGVIHGFPVEPVVAASVDVIAPRNTRPRQGIVIHKLRLHPVEIDQHPMGFLMTDSVRTGLDLLAAMEEAPAWELFCWLREQGLLDGARLARAIRRRRWWRGSLALKAVARRAADSGRSGPDSPRAPPCRGRCDSP